MLSKIHYHYAMLITVLEILYILYTHHICDIIKKEKIKLNESDLKFVESVTTIVTVIVSNAILLLIGS